MGPPRTGALLCIPALLLLLLAGAPRPARAVVVFNRSAARAYPRPYTPQPITVQGQSCALRAFEAPLDNLNATLAALANASVSAAAVGTRNATASPAGTFLLHTIVCDSAWRPGGPIFLFSGSGRGFDHELPYTPWLFDHAAAHRAMVVMADRRYFGYSIPDELFRGAEIDHMGQIQMVEDFVFVLGQVSRLYNMTRPPPAVFFSGGSQLGVLARLLHPELFAGVVAWGARLLGYPGTVPVPDPRGLYTRPSLALNDTNPTCFINARAAFGLMAELANTAAGRQQLNDAFRLCPRVQLRSAADYAALRSWAGTAVRIMVSTVSPAPSPDAPGAPPGLLADACDQLLGDPALAGDRGALLFAFAQFANATFTYADYGDQSCNDLAQDNVRSYLSAAQLRGRGFVDMWTLARDVLNCAGEALNLRYNRGPTGVSDFFVGFPTPGNYSQYIAGTCQGPLAAVPTDYNWGARVFGPNVTSRLVAAGNMVLLSDKYDGETNTQITANLSDSVVAYELPYGGPAEVTARAADVPELRWLRTAVDAQVRRWIAGAPTVAAPAPAVNGTAALALAAATNGRRLLDSPGRRLSQIATVPCPDCRCLSRTPNCAFCFREDADGAKCWDDSASEDGSPVCSQCLVIFR